MSLYLIRFSYKPESWADLVENPEDRRGVVSSLVEAVGGSLEGMWYSFGGQDGYVLVDAPDNVSAAAGAIAAAAGGAVTSVQTDVLLTVEETLDALKKAQSVSYARPGR